MPLRKRSPMPDTSSAGRDPERVFSSTFSLLALRLPLPLVFESARHAEFHDDLIHNRCDFVRGLVYGAAFVVAGSAPERRAKLNESDPGGNATEIERGGGTLIGGPLLEVLLSS